jgi:hypothetical protein
MGDAIHDDVSVLAGVSGLQLVAGYVTGSPAIAWTAADWARFPGIPQATVDQGYTGSPVATAVVRDVEAGAWAAGSAVGTVPWTPARPTIYCSENSLPAVLAAGWHGCLWLAIPGWEPGDALPSAPGCTVVAVQNQPDVASAYDLSVVLDPTWPLEAVITNQESSMIIHSSDGAFYLLSGGRLHHITDPTSLACYQAAGLPSAGPVTAGEEAALLNDFPAGELTVTIPPVTIPAVEVTFPTFDVTGTIAPA